MEQKYKTILTHHGERVIVEALANKIPVPLKEMAIGDGNGSSITPSASQTTLVREVYRAEITDLLEDPQNRHQMIAELLIPENVGGFIVREIGLFDEQGGLVAVANCPENYKPVLEQGSGKVQYYRMILQVSSSDAVTLSINNNIVYATRTELNEFVNNLSSPDGYKHIGRCKSVAELRTIRPSEHGQRILVDAYYEGGTTGGGEFMADLQDLTTPDDGGTCFVVADNGGRWKRLFASSLQDTDFGVIGDGVADDTANLNAFLNALRTYKVKGYFTSRHYTTSAALNIAGVDIEGVLAGYKNKQGTRITGSGNHNIFEQVGVELQHITYSLKNFALSDGIVGLKMTYAVNAVVENVFIDNVERAFLLGDSQFVGPIWCSLKNCRGEGRVSGLEIDGNKWANANMFETCFFKGDEFATSITAKGGIGAVANHFVNTEFAGKGFGVKLGKNKSTAFDNCYFECEGPALLIEDSTADLTLNDATFGSLTEYNKTGKTAFIHHIAGSCNLVINSGCIYLSGRNQNNLTFIESEKPESFVLNMPTPVKREIYTATGFKLFRNPALPNKISRIQYTSSYTCEFTSANQDAALGNGELVAYYNLNNSRCGVTLNLKIGSSTVKGTGQWQFRLPLPASSIAKYHLGQAVALKADGSLLKAGVARIVGSSNHVVAYFDNVNAADATRPFEWTEGDRLDISIEYEI
ncbi:phage tail protein [Mannheimia haemolytica]